MTDKSKYSNVTVDNKTYAIITQLQTRLMPEVTLSRSQVIKTIVNEKAKKINGKLNK
jgi:hypothetical protein